MEKHGKTKQCRGNSKQYTQDDIYRCLDGIINRKMSISQAAKYYKIPKSTVFSKLKNGVPVQAKFGPPSIVSADNEKLIIRWIFFCCDRGFPVTKNLLLDSVKKYIVDQKIANPFTDNRPGRHWFDAFRKRHPELSPRMVQNLSASRALPTRERLRSWFNKVEQYLISTNLKDIDPSRIMNLEESVFSPCPKAGYMFARKGSKSVHNVVTGNDKNTISVLFTITGAGEMAPPMISFSYQRLPSVIARKIPDGWSVGNTENGWMTSESFYEYVANVLYPWAVKKGIEFPIIIYLDGHTPHVTYLLVKFCMEKNIELISLFPNATHLLQPLDVSFFHPLKVSWKETIDEFRVENGFKLFKKENFAPLLKKSVDKLVVHEIVKNEFATSGLNPLSPELFDYNVVETGTQNSAQQSMSVQHKVHLQYFEETILDNWMLAEFRSGVISDPKIDELFKAWKKMKHLSGNLIADLILFLIILHKMLM